jgi:hypothetical protein
MTISPLSERYQKNIAGIISCYDRIIVQGTLPILSYALGMTQYLSKRGIRIFDFIGFVKPLTEAIKNHAEQLAEKNGLKVDYIRKKNFRKEDRIKEVLHSRGTHPGLVWIFSALEPCTTYQPWYDKKAGNAYLRPDDGKCLHYYFYFIDPDLGLCYLRVPTWCPFRLQFYCNGHNWLARQLDRLGIVNKLLDNAFTSIADFARAQQLSDSWKPSELHRKLDHFVHLYCPVLRTLDESYHWSLDTVEYATDIVFRRQDELQPIYEHLLRTVIHAVKPDDIATFLGKKLNPQYQGEMGNRYNVRIHGSRLRHSMGAVSLKMYDKFGHILRIETTTRDVTFFKHYRKVGHSDGTSTTQFAPVRKTIYSLGPLRELLLAANHRYLDFLSAIDDQRASTDKLTKLTKTITEKDRSYRGFNFFDDQDHLLFQTIARGEFNLSGFKNKHLRQFLTGKSSGQISRIIKRLRLHGLIKKVTRCYKYYLTRFGKQVLLLGLKLKELVIIPELASIPIRQKKILPYLA